MKGDTPFGHCKGPHVRRRVGLSVFSAAWWTELWMRQKVAIDSKGNHILPRKQGAAFSRWSAT